LALRTLVTIWVAASELASPGTAALVSTARDALGDQIEVRLEAAPPPPPTNPDGVPLAVESQVVRAGAVPAGAGVVELTWEDPSGARLRCYLPSAGRWIDRSVRFSADDPPAAVITAGEVLRERRRQPAPAVPCVANPARDCPNNCVSGHG
jgi:hypothetical protein